MFSVGRQGKNEADVEASADPPKEEAKMPRSAFFRSSATSISGFGKRWKFTSGARAGRRRQSANWGRLRERHLNSRRRSRREGNRRRAVQAGRKRPVSDGHLHDGLHGLSVPPEAATQKGVSRRGGWYE